MGGYRAVRVKNHHSYLIKEVSRQPITSLTVQEDCLRFKKRPKLSQTGQHAQRLQPVAGEDQRVARLTSIRLGHLKALINLSHGLVGRGIHQVTASSKRNLEIKLDEDLHSQGLDEYG